MLAVTRGSLIETTRPKSLAVKQAIETLQTHLSYACHTSKSNLISTCTSQETCLMETLASQVEFGPQFDTHLAVPSEFSPQLLIAYPAYPNYPNPLPRCLLKRMS